MNLLETKGLCHDFQKMTVLSDVNLKIRTGERHAVIGPNGAGKTTLFNVISGFYRPRSGRVLFKGKKINGGPVHKLARLGMSRSFQITSTLKEQTVFQNIRVGLQARHGIRFNLFRRIEHMRTLTEETDRLLVKLQLHDVRNTPAGQLSYGEQRSLELGMAMSTNPDLVMLDEPTAGMSAEETHDAIAMIKMHTEGRTMVIIEHDMDVVFALADRITVLHIGSILAEGTPDEIRRNPLVREAYWGKKGSLA